MRRHLDQRGSIAAIEILGVIPLAAAIAGSMFQLYLMGQAGVEAESAARLAARELSKGADPSDARDAGTAQANPRFEVIVYTDFGLGEADEPNTGRLPGTATAVATATVPFLGIGIPWLDIKLERSAVMPADVGL